MSMRLPMRQRRWPFYIVGAIVLLAVLFTIMSQFYVDLLWFREVRLTSVFWTTLRTKSALGLIFGLIFFGLLYVNLRIVQRISPSTRILTPDQEVIERIRQGFEPYLRWLLPAACGLLALFVGIGVSKQWQTFLLWRNSGGVVFGAPEPLFGRDPAFYIFSLPWLRFLQGWLFSSLVGVTFLTAVAHVLWGGIRPQAPGLADKVDSPARAHLSVLLGLIVLVKAWGYYLGRFDLLTSPRGVVEGASYTDVHAQLPALNLLAIVAVICAVLFFVNIRIGNWALPLIAVALLGLVSILIGTAYPAFVQRFRVAPQELQREQEFIEDNIAGTRTAFGLDDVVVDPNRPVDPVVTAADLQNNDTTISNIRLWRPEILLQNFQSLQRIRNYYDFRDADVDRYDVNGVRRVLMVSGREVTQQGIPSTGGTWQNQHLVYTHGFGAVAAQVNSATTEGAPLLTLKDIPPVGIPSNDQPRIYYGEGIQGNVPFVIVNSNTPELDREGAPPIAYSGEGGISMGGVVQRALFAWRYRDVNLLISGQIRSDSRIMINRTLQERVPRPVPFLGFDADPYLASTQDGLKWIWDAYTSTEEYPYAQEIDLLGATDGALGGTVNYLRNSVKAVTDAYDGTLTYYADDTDPIIQVWMRAFPGVFTPISEAPADLQAHFRYPENLFQVQASQFANYHVTNPEIFYQKQDFWQIPGDPTRTQSTTAATSGVPAAPLRPYYVLMKVPGDTTEHFQLVLPFVPEGRNNMVAWMAANSDPDGYGDMVAFTFPTGVNIDGPSQVFQRINQDPQFSTERTLLGQGGSEVLFGDFLVIPVESSFLYVQPVYVRASQSAGSATVPELKRVVVANGDTVGVGATLQEALDSSVVGEVPGGNGGNDGGNGGGGGTVAERVANLLSRALQHFQAADEALTAGDLATYQLELQQAQDLVQQANDLAAQGGGSSTSPTPTPTATPSASPSASG